MYLAKETTEHQPKKKARTSQLKTTFAFTFYLSLKKNTILRTAYNARAIRSRIIMKVAVAVAVAGFWVLGSEATTWQCACPNAKRGL